MSDPTGLPSSRPRKVLTDISPVTWEHPADRAALQTLRAVPGFDDAVRKIIGFFTESGIRLMFQANAVRVGPTQFPKLHDLMTDVKTTLDWPHEVPLFVSQTPLVNAGAYGVDEPFIVLNSGAVSLLDYDEMRALIGHELGHVMSGHALYRTILVIILTIGFQNLPFLAGLALLPIRLALLEWSRKAELSADRAGLLATQNRDDALRIYLKLAGGGRTRLTSHVKVIDGPGRGETMTLESQEALSEMNLEAFLEQAESYQKSGGPLDAIYRILNMLDATHPFHTLRVAELRDWYDSGEYTKIMDGDYIRRSDREHQPPLTDDIGKAAGYYAREAKQAVSEVADGVRRAARAFSDAIKNASNQ
jgi:Zn-dependent protease with chaperone function